MSSADQSRPLRQSISGETIHEIEIKRSRFIAHIRRVDSLPDAERYLGGLRKQYWDARHHCSALVIGPHGDQQRSNDDGEPAGTAGLPMLEVLRQRGLTDVIAVVVRYFGGTLLGAGGLVRAYNAAVGECLDLAPRVTRSWQQTTDLAVPITELGRVENQLRLWLDRNGGTFLGVEYGQTAIARMAISPDSLRALEAQVATVTSGAGTLALGALAVVETAA
ncbi:hypothetical protein GCM10010401_14540 [Rarobacter faecitabidus]|uniref:Putative YigZ family protein n=1 Tax=Rarobacter faecitabidus TaxID=13243 RepID=A0A542ZDZ0_RARFA|nr:YigZ family protein [Rarobacter faecitabidus]TQL58499.1 putative YigZ family protein [Rarobacter faecitabidus]